MNTKLAAAAAVFVLIFGMPHSADARHHHRQIATPAGHLVPNNDGKSSWVSDANGSPAANTTRKSRGQRVSRSLKGRLASTDSAHVLERTSDVLKADTPVLHNGMVQVRTVQGFSITVHPAYADKFLRFFALLKEHGYKVPANITRCWAPHGTHVAGSNHYIGAACDIQTGWNRGPSFVYHMDALVRQAGLYSGCAFHDCGHVEAIRGTHNHAPNLYASIEKFKASQSTASYQP